MKVLAPYVFRQRLIMEAIYSIEPDENKVREYLLGLAHELGLRVYCEPLVHSPEGQGKAENQGFDAFVPLIDSGISAYVWSAARLLSVLVYSCKRFDPQRAVDYTRQYWQVEGSLEHKEF
jgi:S-adenosylmethionine/arginine decarboxylase-like enzyme